MACKRCGSFAINHNEHGRDGSEPELCDVCYWRSKAEKLTDLLTNSFPIRDEVNLNRLNQCEITAGQFNDVYFSIKGLLDKSLKDIINA